MSAVIRTAAGAHTVDVVSYANETVRADAIRATARLRAVIASVLVGMLLILTGLLGSSSANASWISEGVKSVFCSSVYTGTTIEEPSWVPSTARGAYNSQGALKAGHGLTAYEKYGMSGLSWSTWIGPDTPDDLRTKDSIAGKKLQELVGGHDSNSGLSSWGGSPEKQDVFYNKNEACGDFLNSGASASGNALMALSGLITHLAGLLYQMSFETSSSIVKDLEPTINEVVSHLVEGLYLEFVSAVVMIGALWLGYQGLVKRRTGEFVSGGLWMFGAAVAGMMIISNPTAIPTTINGIVGGITQGVVSTISSPTVGVNDEGMCTIDTATSAATDRDGKQVDASVRSNVRAVQCSFYTTFMFNPWVQGQFGHSLGDDVNGIDYIAGEYGVLAPETPALKDAEIPKEITFGDRKVEANWALLQLDSRVLYPGSDEVNQGRQQMHVASAQTFRDEPNRAWTGSTSLNRVVLALISLVGVLSMGLMVIIISLEMIVLEIGLVILIMLAPLFALIGVHPGMGRKVALRWVNTLLELALRRIVLALLLAVMMLVYGGIVAATATTFWVISVILTAAVGIAGIHYKGKLTQMFSSSVNIGGAGKMDLGDGIVDDAMKAALKGGKFVSRVGTGAVTGGVMGAAKATVEEGKEMLQNKAANGAQGDGAPRPMNNAADAAAALAGITTASGGTAAEKAASTIGAGARVGVHVGTDKVDDHFVRLAEMGLAAPRPSSAVAAGVAGTATYGQGGVTGGVAAGRAAASRDRFAQERHQQQIEKDARRMRRQKEESRLFRNLRDVTEEIEDNPDHKVDLRPVAEPSYDSLRALAEKRVAIEKKAGPTSKETARIGAVAAARSRNHVDAARRAAAATAKAKQKVAAANAFRESEIAKEIDHLKKLHARTEEFKVKSLAIKARAEETARRKAEAARQNEERKAAAAARAKEAEHKKLMKEMSYYTPGAAAARRKAQEQKEWERTTPEGKAFVRARRDEARRIKMMMEGPGPAQRRLDDAKRMVQADRDMAELTAQARKAAVKAEKQAAEDVREAAAEAAKVARKEAAAAAATLRRAEKQIATYEAQLKDVLANHERIQAEHEDD